MQIWDYGLASSRYFRYHLFLLPFQHFNSSFQHRRFKDNVVKLSQHKIITRRNVSFFMKFTDGDSVYHRILINFSTFKNLLKPVNKTVYCMGHHMHCNFSRSNLNKYNAEKQQFQFIINQGIQTPSKTSYSSVIHVASKSSGNIRPFGYYRKFTT